MSADYRQSQLFWGKESRRENVLLDVSSEPGKAKKPKPLAVALTESSLGAGVFTGSNGAAKSDCTEESSRKVHL